MARPVAAASPCPALLLLGKPHPPLASGCIATRRMHALLLILSRGRRVESNRSQKGSIATMCVRSDQRTPLFCARACNTQLSCCVSSPTRSLDRQKGETDLQDVGLGRTRVEPRFRGPGLESRTRSLGVRGPAYSSVRSSLPMALPPCRHGTCALDKGVTAFGPPRKAYLLLFSIVDTSLLAGRI